MAQFYGGAWLRLIPQTGWLVWDAGLGQLLVWTGIAWTGLDVAMNLLTRAPSVRVAAGTAGSATDMVVAEELFSGLSGVSVTSTIAISNRAIALGVSTRTVTAITGASSCDCGISGETSKFGGSPGVASANVGVIGPQAFYAATPIILTANGGNFTGGAVRIAIHCLLPIAPQSGSKRFQPRSVQIDQNSPTLRVNSDSFLLETLKLKGNPLTPPNLDAGFVRMPQDEFEAMLARAAERGARRALADVGLDGPEAAIDIHELRTLLDSLRMARRTAWQTIIRLMTTGLLLALIAGIAVKLKLFG